jgi:translation initiation factor 4G
MLSLRATNKDRPANMALLDFPHKKKRQMKTQGDQMTEADKFNHTVRELRILLNKLSKDNFENVTKHILNDYQFTPALLNELMKIIFMKATTENTYLELYVRLCILLFRKYNDKDNVEMNFKKLILNKCQKQFQKLKAREEQERKSRRQSMEIALQKQQMEEDFNKQMLFVYDTDEIKHRQRLQLFGNMSLLVELFIQNQI